MISKSYKRMKLSEFKKNPLKNNTLRSEEKFNEE
jgi:hypothetical protein